MSTPVFNTFPFPHTSPGVCGSPDTKALILLSSQCNRSPFQGRLGLILVAIRSILGI
jgi:hypothetical protein